MNCIDKERSIKEDIASIENRVRHAFNQGYDFGFKDGKEKAKSQEPILDKIRNEIEKQEKWLLQAGYNAYNADIAFDAIKAAIAESEE